MEYNGITISSSSVRRALEGGDISLATALLGRPYCFSGPVVHGKQLGRTLGYPTANIQVDESLKLMPPDGVYAVRVTLDGHVYGGDDEQRHASHGGRPSRTFDRSEHFRLFKRYLRMHPRSRSPGVDTFGKKIQFARKPQGTTGARCRIVPCRYRKIQRQESLKNGHLRHLPGETLSYSAESAICAYNKKPAQRHIDAQVFHYRHAKLHASFEAFSIALFMLLTNAGPS